MHLTAAATTAANAFHRTIDELFLIDRPLAPREIKRLIATNELPEPDIAI